MRTIAAVTALLFLFAAGACGGEEDVHSIEALVVSSQDLGMDPPLVTDTLRKIGASELAAGAQDPTNRLADLGEWGFRTGATGCLSRPLNCDRSAQSSSPDVVVLDIVLLELSEEGAADAFAAYADDIERRLRNLADRRDVAIEVVEGFNAADETREFRQSYGSGIARFTAHQLVFRQGEYVVVMSTLMPTDGHEDAVLQSAASAQAAKLTGHTSDD